MRLLLVLVLIFGSLRVSAQEQMQEFNETGVATGEDVVQVKQDATQNAIEKVSGKLIRDLIGDSKFDKNLSTIKAKVFSVSDKYIPFVKTGTPKRVGAETQLPVNLKVSISSLEVVLQKAGLMTNTEGPAVVLPVVTYFDLVNNKVMKWWLDNPEELNPTLKEYDRVFVETMKTEFGKLGFHVQDPQTWQYRRQVPQALLLDSLRAQDYLALAENFKAHLALRGEFRVEAGRTSQSYKITGRFSVLHSQNGRVVADSVRAMETESGAFSAVVPKLISQISTEVLQELGGQVQEAWTRGTLGASLVRLAIKGNFEFKDVEQLKLDIRTQLKVVKSITERLFTRSGVEFEVDVAGGPEALAKTLEKFRSAGRLARVESVSGNRLEIRF